MHRTVYWIRRRYPVYVVHRDHDGISGAVLLSYIKRGRIYFSGFFPEKEVVGEALDQGMPVFVDLGYDRAIEALVGERRIVEFSDHEDHYKGSGVVSLNSHEQGKPYASSSVMVWEACMTFWSGMYEKLSWIAGVGTLGDYSLRDAGTLLRAVRENYPELLRGDPLKSELMDMADVVKVAGSLGVGPWRIFRKLGEYEKNPGEFMRDREVEGWWKVFEEEWAKVLEAYDEREEVGPFVVVEVPADVKLGKWVAGKLNVEMGGEKIYIAVKRKKFMASCLYGSYDCRSLARIYGGDGPHRLWGVGYIRDYEEFVESLYEVAGLQKKLTEFA